MIKLPNTYPSTMRFVPECLMTQKVCGKAVNRCFSYLILFLINIKLKKCATVLFVKILFSIRYDLDQYKTQQMCDKAVDDCLAALQFVPDWFVTS